MRLALPGLVVIGVSTLLFAPGEAAGPAPAQSAAFILRHQVDATVSRVDRDAGVLLLKTDAGRLTLDAPAGAVSALQKGDALVLDIAVLRHPDPARIPRDKGSDHPLLVRTLVADVAGVDRTVGLVALKTSAGALNVELPRTAIADIRTGDRLSVELTVLRESDAAAMPRVQGAERRAGLAALLLRLFGRQGVRSRQ